MGALLPADDCSGKQRVEKAERNSLGRRASVDVGAQSLTFADRQQLLESTRLELADALATDSVPSSDFFERQRLAVGGSEAQPQNIGFALRQLRQRHLELFTEIDGRRFTLRIV